MPAFLAPHRPAVLDRLRLHHPAAAGRQPLFAELPVAGIPAAAAEGGVVPRRHRHRHDAGDPAGPDRSFRALGGDGGRHDGLRRGRLWTARRGARHSLRHLCGMLMGLINGFGVAYLRIPSMIITLGTNAVAQGLMVLYRRLRAAGFAPPGDALPGHRARASSISPTPSSSGIAVGAATVFLLGRTTFGRSVYGIGNKERAAYLSGLPTQRVVMIAFASGGLSAFGGVLLAGYASKAAQSMGDRLSAAGDRGGGAGRHRRSSAGAAPTSARWPASFSSRCCSRFSRSCRSQHGAVIIGMPGWAAESR
jgi:hypothetical protein